MFLFWLASTDGLAKSQQKPQQDRKRDQHGTRKQNQQQINKIEHEIDSRESTTNHQQNHQQHRQHKQHKQHI